MADQLLAIGSGISKRLKDMGDGTFAEVVAGAGGTGVPVSATFLPASTSHTALDSIGGIQNLNFGRGGEFMITSIKASNPTNALASGEGSHNLEFYNATPTSYADDAAWDLPTADLPLHLGSVTLPTMVDRGASLKTELDGINKQITVPASGLVPTYLITNATYTCTATARSVIVEGFWV